MPEHISKQQGSERMTYVQILPVGEPFDPIANLFESSPRILEEIMDSLPHSFRISFGTEEVDLRGKTRDIRGQSEELDGELLCKLIKLGVVLVGWIIFSAHRRWLRLEGSKLIKRHGERISSEGEI